MTASSRDPKWIPCEIATLEILMEDDPAMGADERMNIALLEMREGKSFTQAMIGIKPLTPNHIINKDWIMVQRADDWRSVFVLTATPQGFKFRPKSGLHFDGVAVMDYGQAVEVAAAAVLNRPEGAPHAHLYNAHTGEEVHFIKA